MPSRPRLLTSLTVPRPPRFVLAGSPLHLIQRGNNRTPLFLTANEHREYLAVLLDASVRAGCAIHAYVLMTNHVHLLVTPNDPDGPASLMQMVGRRYVRWFNARHHRTGTLWEGRYRSTVVESARYFLACSRYIELNPLRARMTARLQGYPWSSHRCNAWGGADPLITPHELYGALGPDAPARQAAYRALFAGQLDAELIAAIRRATNAGTILGDASFVERCEHGIGRRLTRWPNGGDRRSERFMRSGGHRHGETC